VLAAPRRIKERGALETGHRTRLYRPSHAHAVATGSRLMGFADPAAQIPRDDYRLERCTAEIWGDTSNYGSITVQYSRHSATPLVQFRHFQTARC